MVVQSVALPTVSGTTRDEEISIVSAATPAAPVRPARSFSFAPAVVPVLIGTQAAWLALLGYGIVRFLI